MPHKPVIRENASTTKVRMVFDASARPHPTANSVNECMHTGPPLQRLLWDILIRARMSTYLLLADLQKAFLQVGSKEDDRDAFRFLFDINGQTGSDIADLEDFKCEATEILEDAKFPVHKWESNVEELDNESNPSKILGHKWNKRKDTLEIRAEPTKNETPVTKRHILKELSSINDPLEIISPTMVEGKRIYREACDEKVGWNFRSIYQHVQRLDKVATTVKKRKNSENTACSAVSIAVIEHSSGIVKGLLTSKSRIAKRNTSIPRLELVSEKCKQQATDVRRKRARTGTSAYTKYNLWGQNVHTIDESDTDDGEEVVKLHKRMKQQREHAWQRWKTEYVHSLMEHH
ncbi:Hypothetical predicted protein [Paramuricea clavata]|uniref:Uncharacterized protein n=1 Tax=Paramuricea clavata TaxID=317549 RepID=A0A6S7HUF1_PARCT|nr:Hypothetical predicted protein [Paramuricea clavata]